MLKCILEPGCGRLVVAAADIPAGKVIFSEEAFTVAPNIEQKNRTFCVYCAGPVTDIHARCDECQSTYCGAHCFETHSAAHSSRGECAAIRLSQMLRPKIPNEDFDTFQMISLVIARCVAEGKEKNLGRDRPLVTIEVDKTSDVETVGLGEEETNPLEFLNNLDISTPNEVSDTSYNHVECLTTNLKNIDPEIIADFSHLYDVYISAVGKRKLMSKLQDAQRFFPFLVSRLTFLSICCAYLCNGFGFWDARSRKRATAIYPRSSYFNHSCAPNLGRRNVNHSRVIEFFAARDILAGEQLCISYVDVKMPAAERIAKLKGTYSFICQCPRCDPGADEMLANTITSDIVPPLCEDCTSKILQPLGGNAYVCPCCDKEQCPA